MDGKLSFIGGHQQVLKETPSTARLDAVLHFYWAIGADVAGHGLLLAARVNLGGLFTSERIPHRGSREPPNRTEIEQI